MQEEITQRTVSLSVEAGKMTADLLQKAVKKVLEEMQKKPSQRTLHQGKQTLHQLKQHGASLTNIEITEQNIKAFSVVAKNFDKLIATIRSREISASIILQSQSQLKTIYKDAADTIVGNCDSTLFLGGKEKSTLKEISELLGKETIDSFNQSENRGSQVSHGLNYQKLGKDMPYLLMKSSAALNLSGFSDLWR